MVQLPLMSEFVAQMDEIWLAAEQYAISGEVIDIQEYGNGNINDTYLVRLGGAGKERFILQRINTHVFTRPKLIIQNLKTYTEHVRQRLEEEKPVSTRRWEVPHVQPTRSGKYYFIDERGSFWRAISFVQNAHTFDTIQNEAHAQEVGFALGRFHDLVSDLPIERMHDTLVGFHITPWYLHLYDEVNDFSRQEKLTAETRYCQDVIAERSQWASILEDAKKQGKLLEKVIHGDPKVNNIMICDSTGQAVSIVDMDTVKPGLVHYDIGDCLRSCCNPLGEDTTALEDIRFEIDLAEIILEGYFAVADTFLTGIDYSYIFDAIRLIAFELGLRYFSDYLAGNIYYKIKHPEHNLERAMVQFRLTESIESQEANLRAIIAKLKPPGK
jgi:Ser/Thr protein kinase RdoA (MazF antagonist)